MAGGLTFVSRSHLDALPRIGRPDRRDLGIAEWVQLADDIDVPALSESIRDALNIPVARRWLEVVFGNSPFLTRLAIRDPSIVIDVMTHGPDRGFERVLTDVAVEPPGETKALLMRRLRIARRHAALIAAMADLAGLWPLEQVTRALSRFAGTAISAVLRYLLRDMAAKGHLRLTHADDPERESGLIVLGMGKLGAYELNYSSDIDLIVLFDAARLQTDDPDMAATRISRLTREMTRILEERTADGYVFRTDLRLRPDPASTPPAVSIDAAEVYYASVGQNWERAAMIKARPVAGDIAAGTAFLASLGPFIWRKHLDFAAIRDVMSMKRQINARHGGSLDSIDGHNIKLGHGGIREIEFFAQTQQLIWGGRLPALRGNGTIATLWTLVEAGRIERSVAEELSDCYVFLRQIEHRLQMIDDRQTHSLPVASEDLASFAAFMGFADLPAFGRRLRKVLRLVQHHFSLLAPDSPPLSFGGNLVFTGKEDDPETLETLTKLGFKEPHRAIALVRAWHHGRIRATRSPRAREILTELVPSLLIAFGRTAHPDYAVGRFDEFLTKLPAGVQLFSLFLSRRELIDLVAEIMGNAPALAERLSRKPLLLDSVLTGDFSKPLPENLQESIDFLKKDLAGALRLSRDFEDTLDIVRRWSGDHKFQIGMQLLRGKITGTQSGWHFTAVAETVLAVLLPAVEADIRKTYGEVPGGRFAVLAFGKMGGREMTSLSDLDLVFIYDAPPEIETSDGPKPLAVPTYYARLSQRLINALTVRTSEGGLYEVDMRLRPSAAAGPIASSLVAFRRYHAEQAWTWEFMALTRARVIAGNVELTQALDSLFREALTKPREPDRLLLDIDDMRRRVAEQHPAPRAWDCKHRRGGMIDIEFIAQYLLLRHAPHEPDLLSTGTGQVLYRLSSRGLLDPDVSTRLQEALALWRQIQGVIRVAIDAVSVGDQEQDIIDRCFARATGMSDQVERDAHIDAAAQQIQAIYDDIIAKPAAQIRKPDTSHRPVVTHINFRIDP